MRFYSSLDCLLTYKVLSETLNLCSLTQLFVFYFTCWLCIEQVSVCCIVFFSLLHVSLGSEFGSEQQHLVLSLSYLVAAFCEIKYRIMREVTQYWRKFDGHTHALFCHQYYSCINLLQMCLNMFHTCDVAFAASLFGTL